MSDSIFKPLAIPVFVDYAISEDLTFCTKLLFLTARKIFNLVYRNYFRSEGKKKHFSNKSSYANFVREFCKVKRGSKVLKYAKEEWGHLTEENKEMYKVIDSPERTGNAFTDLKGLKKPKSRRSTFSLYAVVKYKKGGPINFKELAGVWNNATDEFKAVYQELQRFDEERAEFEREVFSRFELVLRLLGAADLKLLKKFKAFSLYKEEIKASLMERGFSTMPNLEILSRKKYTKLDYAQREKFAKLAKSRNEEYADQLFLKVLKKANIDFRDMVGIINTETTNVNVVEEDFDEFIKQDEANYYI